MKYKIILFLLGLVSFSVTASAQQRWDGNQTVYISEGCRAYAYHKSSTCHHLKECVEAGHVKPVSRSKAIELRRQPCGTCLRAEHTEWKNAGKLLHVCHAFSLPNYCDCLPNDLGNEIMTDNTLAIIPQIGFNGRHYDLGFYYKHYLKDRGIYEYYYSEVQSMGLFVTWYF